MEPREIASIYEEHGWHVFARCQRLLRDEEEARDVCHEVFLRLAASGDAIRGEKGVTPWVFRVSTNLCVDRLRQRKRERVVEAGVEASTAAVEASFADRDLLLKLVGHFSARDLALVVLRHVDELSLEEMEQVCGMTRKTISRRLERFRSRARKIIKRRKMMG
jgi:RNA polymerase sigma-70 factor (ECF subfamily)